MELNSLINLINKYKNKILNIAIFIIALVIANNILKSQTKPLELLKAKKDIEIKKNVVLTDISQLEKKIKSYKNSLNKKEVSSVINTVSNIAKDSGVRVISIKPLAEESYPAYIKYPFDLTVGADNYHIIGKFISKLESHPDVYILESTDIKHAMAEARERSQVGQVGKLTVDLRLSTILLKD